MQSRSAAAAAAGSARRAVAATARGRCYGASDRSEGRGASHSSKYIHRQLFLCRLFVITQGVAWRGAAPSKKNSLRAVWAAKPPKQREKGDSVGAAGPHTPN